jgi:hypothetical protein
LRAAGKILTFLSSEIDILAFLNNQKNFHKICSVLPIRLKFYTHLRQTCTEFQLEPMKTDQSAGMQTFEVIAGPPWIRF